MFDPYASFQNFQLSNGIPVHHLHLSSAKKQSIGFLLHSGTYHSCTYPGLGHFVEHIVANSAGCKTLQKEMAEEGGSLLGSGGMTYSFGTGYGFDLPTGHAMIPSLVQRFKDYVFANPLSHSIDFEKSPFTAERAERFSDVDETSKKFLRYRALGGGWAAPDIGFGTNESIKNISLADVTAYYRKHYTPANLSVLCVGSLSREAFEKTLTDAGWASLALAGQRFTPPTHGLSAPAPLLGRFAIAVPRISNTELTAVAQLPRSFSNGVLRVATRVIQRYFNQFLREEKGIVYHVRVSWNNWRGTHAALVLVCQGVSPSRTAEFWSLYQTACGDIQKPSVISGEYIEKCRRSSYNSILSYEETSEQIYHSSISYLFQEGGILTDTHLLEEISAASHDHIRAAIASLCSVTAYTELDLPEGTPAPAGLPLYGLHAAADALAQCRLPTPLNT